MILLLLTLVFSQSEINKLDNLFNRMDPSTRVHIESLAKGFDPERSLRIQYHLLQDDLEWQKRGFTERQKTMIGTMAIYKATGLAEEGIKAIREPDEEQLERILKAQKFIDDAEKMIKKKIGELGEIRDYEIKFFF